MEYRKRTRSTPPKVLDGEIGYRRPPAHGRFKPGQSGNPKGRPRRPTTAAAELLKSLRAEMPVTIDGKRKKMRRDRALYEGLVRDALKGDNAARRLVIPEMRRAAEAEAPVESAAVPAVVAGPADDEILKRYRQELFEEFKKKQRKAKPANDETDQ
jgi:hypothetical protein